MRTGPFSNIQIIQKLNAYFVPVYAVNEEYRDKGNAPTEERAALDAIHKEGYAKHFSVGTVHVYILNASGTLTNTSHVAEAAQTPKLAALLDKVIEQQKPILGLPTVLPKPQSCPPSVPAGSLILHLTARPLTGQGSWDGISEDWITYTPQERKSLLPTGKVTVGIRWTPDEALLRRLLLHFYPVTENNDVNKSQVMEQSVSAAIISVGKGTVRAKLEGKIVMTHWFYHKDDGKIVTAPFTGYMDFDPVTRQIRTVRIATTGATYSGGEFGIAVRSENPAL